MRFLDELFDIDSNRPLEITEEKISQAEYMIDDHIQQLRKHNDDKKLALYLRSRKMLDALKLEYYSRH